MAAYRRVYDSRHLQADYQERGSAPEPYASGNRVWATFRGLPFYRAMLCIRGTSHGPVSVSVRLSVTSRSSTKTVERIGLVFGM